MSKYGYLSSTYSKYDLMTIMSKIRASGFASKVDDVLCASVPLIRITDKKTGLDIDLTAADTHGMKATEAVQKWTKHDEELVKALITVVKMFLAIRKCGTTYTGGVNSYVLVWMVVAWVKLEWPKMKRSNGNSARAVDERLSSLTSALQGLSVGSTSGLASNSQGASSAVTSAISRHPMDFGEALKGFFKFYGKEFDYSNRSIKIEPQPTFQAKSYVYSRYAVQRYLLSIIDPANSSIDMGEKAYAIKHIQASFKYAYERILKLEARPWSEYAPIGILGIVLEGDFTKFVEKRNRLALAQN